MSARRMVRVTVPAWAMLDIAVPDDLSDGDAFAYAKSEALRLSFLVARFGEPTTLEFEEGHTSWRMDFCPRDDVGAHDIDATDADNT